MTPTPTRPRLYVLPDVSPRRLEGYTPPLLDYAAFVGLLRRSHAERREAFRRDILRLFMRAMERTA